VGQVQEELHEQKQLCEHVQHQAHIQAFQLKQQNQLLQATVDEQQWRLETAEQDKQKVAHLQVLLNDVTSKPAKQSEERKTRTLIETELLGHELFCVEQVSMIPIACCSNAVEHLPAAGSILIAPCNFNQLTFIQWFLQVLASTFNLWSDQLQQELQQQLEKLGSQDTSLVMQRIVRAIQGAAATHKHRGRTTPHGSQPIRIHEHDRISHATVGVGKPRHSNVTRLLQPPWHSEPNSTISELGNAKDMLEIKRQAS
jgi:hypothetical protein